MIESASSSFCFTFLKMVAWSWKVVVLCHPCDRSLLSLMFPPFACLSWRRSGWFLWWWVVSESWKKRGFDCLSFLGDVDGYAGIWQGCCSLSLFVGMRPFCFLLLFLFLGVAFIHFLKRHPLISLCKFTTSGDSQGHTQGACLQIFFIVFGCSGSYFKNNQDIFENNMGHLLSFLAFSLLVLFRT